MKFWNWVHNDGGERVLRLEGAISENESWWGDEITPKMFRDDLFSGSGDITVWINSPGGDVFAAAQIYNMLLDYPGNVTVKIDGIAASAASVIAMAGNEVLMSPISMLMLHNPYTFTWGDSEEMSRAKEMLDEVKESIINVYVKKTGLPRAKLSQMMSEETWMNANKAVELGFADKIMFTEKESEPQNINQWYIFSRLAVTNSLINKFSKQNPEKHDELEKPIGTPIDSLDKRLNLLLH